MKQLPIVPVIAAMLFCMPSHAAANEQAESRARATEASMTQEESVILTHGIMALPFTADSKLPDGAIPGAGFVPGIARLGVPPLTETDASLGVAWVAGIRGPEGATPLPSGLAMGSTWNRVLIQKAGAMIGAEAKAKGFNVLLAGGVNLIREPRKGRAFEYFSEDPLLSGVLAGEAVAGIQSNHIISTVKHFAVNAQETGRAFIDSRISDGAARESDLLAFQIAIERGKPGSVMCAYNKVNGVHSCENDYLLNQVLKRDWRYPGFVMSDWGAVHSLEAAKNGLDQQSGSQLDVQRFFDGPLKDAAARDPIYAARLADMNRRILYAIYANGLDKHPPVRQPIDVPAGLAVAEAVAQEGIVLLRNERGVLPLAASAKKIAVIGTFADTGVLAGSGSSQVQMTGGPAATIPRGPSDSLLAPLIAETYHRSPPLAAIKALAPGAEITFARSDYVAEAVKAARKADVVILFATGWRTEMLDVPDLSLPRGQDELIAAVAKTNPNTIVVLETGGPILMPWLEKTAAVLQAWYPGGRGGEAIASILFGKVNPSGRLPITFPASLDQLPRPILDGLDMDIPPFGSPPQDLQLAANYDIEGSDVGYRWYAARGQKPLFPFGFGLSYTSFERGPLKIRGLRATVAVTNTGSRTGSDVVQLYMVARPDGPKRRLLGFQRVEIKPGERREIAIDIDPRLIADWKESGWKIEGGTYELALGEDAERLYTPVKARFAERRWVD